MPTPRRLHADMIYDHIKAASLPRCVEGCLGDITVALSIVFFVCFVLFFLCVNHNIWTTGSAVISLWGLVPLASLDWHFCDLATTGARTCSHHSNNPLESAEKKKKKKTSPVPLCSLAKCQESSAGCAPREVVDWQSSMFVPVSFKQPIHYSCSHWRFLQVSRGSQCNCV